MPKKLAGSYKGNRWKRWNTRPRTIDEIFGIDHLQKGEESMSHFGGKTEDAGAPILGAKYWKKGIQIKGTVVRSFATDNGTCYVIKLLRPMKVNRLHTSPAFEGMEDMDKVSVGALKGFGMALQAAGLPDARLLTGDRVQITCIGSSPTGKGNDQINFDVQVDRGDDVPF
jgi:hypothetical protein